MSSPPEHNYIGLGGGDAGDGALNLKETELRLGLPGSESSGRDLDKVGFTLELLPPKSFVSGAKRGFSDAIDAGAGKWVFPAGAGGSEVEMGKGGTLFSPRGDGKDAAAMAAARGTKASGQAGNSGGNHREMAPAAPAPKAVWFSRNTKQRWIIYESVDGSFE